MRILVVIDSLGLGGAESLLVPFAAAAGRAGAEVSVAALERRADGDERMDAELRKVGVAPEVLGITRLLQPDGVVRLARHIRRTAPDIVHAHLGYSMTLGVPAARIARIPVVGTLHHIPGDLPRGEAVKERLMVVAAQRSDRCLFVSEAQRREFCARYPALDARCTVITNGIDLPDHTGHGSGLDPAHPVVTILAALRHPKGHRFAISAWPDVVGKVPGARLRIVGTGPEEPSLRRQVVDLGLAEAVEFAGFHRDLGPIISTSSLLLSASETEALPTSLMEAAAFGVPSVATDVGGTAEVVDHEVTGLLVPPRDAPALGAAVTRLLLDGPGRATMARAARERAEREFSADAWWGRLAGLYVAVARSRTTLRRRS